MKDFWNSRYAEKEFAYGMEPNEYFKHEIDKLKHGKLLLPAEGEGRNAVYAAKTGWDVLAIDISEKGKEKALKLAAENNTMIEYQVSELQNYQYPENEFDMAVLIFAHFPADLRSIIHKMIAKSLKIIGILIMEAFSKNQLKYDSGGPKNIDMLYSLEEILSDFERFEIDEAVELKTELHEGEFHNGIAEVIRLKATKKK